LTAFIDTNVLVRHLTGDPPETAVRASRYLQSGEQLYLADLVAAEIIYVLESYYQAPREQIAGALRSLIALPSIITVDSSVLLRAVEVYEEERIDFAEAYLVACAESTGVDRISSFDRSLDRVESVQRIEPGRT
jgi:predicted nucleic acid-binding protein